MWIPVQIIQNFYMKPINHISAVIPAAGLSTRMGKNKLLLPWGSTTIIGRIIETISLTGIEDIFVVIDPKNHVLKEQLDYIKKSFPVSIIEKTEAIQRDMLSSIQIGLKMVKNTCKSVLIALGDQPQIQIQTIEKLVEELTIHESCIVIPSFNMRRGHPWLIPSDLFEELLKLDSSSTARDFLNHFQSSIRYVDIDNDSILKDIDTPGEYQQAIVAFESEFNPDTQE